MTFSVEATLKAAIAGRLIRSLQTELNACGFPASELSTDAADSVRHAVDMAMHDATRQARDAAAQAA
ncbi:hypothetical protein [Paraburkholderia caledonica]|uniref:hypothetical protein n=1 Tax=Paraburkholderia caledonica TaxID=134536 RepID=UPI000DEF76FF|nr:hypothetical protein [Paraburkholderia caledonica]AXF14799.1 hypothetical protein CUJ87_10560 [Paraburkholderia caledonica]